jgi:DNA-binding transcriptional LysR family regulator
MRFDITSLEVIEKVAETGSVAMAAAALNKAPSAISYHLRRLEEQLGASLFDRSKYRLMLTPAGEAVLAKAGEVLMKARELSGLAAQWREGWEVQLDIYIDGSLPVMPIFDALAALEGLGAPTRIQLHTEFLDGVQSAFNQHDGDILISATPKASLDVTWFQLDPLEFVLCCAAGHALSRPDLVGMGELKAHTELIVSGIDDGSTLARQYFGAHRTYFLSDFQSKLEAIRRGLGFGWLPFYLAAPILGAGELHEIPLSAGSRFTLLPAIGCRQDKLNGRAASHIISMIRHASQVGSSPGYPVGTG